VPETVIDRKPKRPCWIFYEPISIEIATIAPNLLSTVQATALCVRRRASPRAAARL